MRYTDYYFSLLAMMMAPATVHAQMSQDFDGNGNTAYHLSGASDVTENGNAFVRLSDTDGDNNSLSFDEQVTVTGPAPNGKILAFDFRLTGESLGEGFVGGLGAGFFASGVEPNFVPWGIAGARNPGVEDADTDWEIPSFVGAATLGLQPGNNTVTLSAFEVSLNSVTAPFELADGQFHRAILTVTPNPADSTKALFDVDFVQDVNGSAVSYNLMTDVDANINLSGLPRNRVMAGARSVGGALVADVDNFSVNFIPEPGSATLAALAAVIVGVTARRRRRAA